MAERDIAYLLNAKAPYFAEIERRYGAYTAEEVTAEFREGLEDFFSGHGHFPEAVAMHAEENILPIGLLYLSLKKRTDPDSAYALVRDVMEQNCRRERERIQQRIREAGTAEFFREWEENCRSAYGAENGFSCVFHRATEEEVRLEVRKCLYLEMLEEMGCPELTRIFCDSDWFEMGDLEEVTFERKGTIAYGSEECDFLLKVREEGEEKQR